MAISDEYRKKMKEHYTRIVYQMSKNKLFIAVGLELISIDVILDDNDSFNLKDVTFAYYNPITNTIHINIEDPFFTKAISEQDRIGRMFFIVFHEACHKLLMHTTRINGRDPNLWNIAADYEVHNMLYLNSELVNSDTNSTGVINGYINTAVKIITNNHKRKKINRDSGEVEVLFSEKMLDKIAEEIYQLIQNSKVEEQTTFYMPIGNDNSNNGIGNTNDNKSNSNNESNNSSNDDNNDNSNDNSNNKNNENSGSGNVKITKTTYTLPDGSKHSVVSIDWPDPKKFDGKSDEERQNDINNQELRKQLWENSISTAAEKGKGSLSSSIKHFLKKLFRVKLDWEKILKNSLNTILQKADEFSWAKTRMSTFALDLPTLPGIDDSESGKGTLIVARDESGSMSDQDIAAAASIILDAKEHYKKIIVIKHDVEIAETREFEEASDEVKNMLLTRSACGGTSHQYVFSFLIDYYKKHLYDEDKISCFISITDGCSDIQQYQDDVPGDIPMVYLVPANCLEWVKGVRGQIIPIEI